MMSKVRLLILVLFGCIANIVSAQEQVEVFIWDDTNGNGIQDGGEAGISGLDGVLDIYEDLNANDDADGGENLNINPTEGAAGEYTFDFTGSASNFIVVLSAQTPTWYPTLFGAGDDASDTNTDSDLNPLISSEGLISHPFPMAVGDPIKTNVDFGLVAPASIGDMIWADMNGDGTQDLGEGGVPDGLSFEVSITDEFSNPVDDLDGNPLGPVSPTGGTYIFDLVRPGTYILTFSDATGIIIIEHKTT